MEKSPWVKLGYYQLIGALSRRGLDTKGKKNELIERIEQYEAKKSKTLTTPTAVGGNEPKKASEKENGAHVKGELDNYYLERKKLVASYRGATALLTVLISPFETSFFKNDSFVEQIAKAKTCEIKKIWNGTSAAVLHFCTLRQSEDAFLELKKELASVDVDVFHASMLTHFELSNMRNTNFEHLFQDSDEDNAGYERLVIADNLPDDATDVTLAEAIPNAVEVIDLSIHEECQGCFLVVFNSKKTCADFLEKNANSVKIGDTTIRCRTLVAREIAGGVTRARKEQAEKQNEKKKAEKETPIKLTDAERLAKVKEWNSLNQSRNTLQDREDIQGYQKMVEMKNVALEISKLGKILQKDTQRRLKEKLPIPEPEKLQTPLVRFQVLKKEKATINIAKEEAKVNNNKASALKRKMAANVLKKATTTLSSARGGGAARRGGRGGVARGGSSAVMRGVGSTWSRGTAVRGGGITRGGAVTRGGKANTRGAKAVIRGGSVAGRSLGGLALGASLTRGGRGGMMRGNVSLGSTYTRGGGVARLSASFSAGDTMQFQNRAMAHGNSGAMRGSLMSGGPVSGRSMSGDLVTPAANLGRVWNSQEGMQAKPMSLLDMGDNYYPDSRKRQMSMMNMGDRDSYYDDVPSMKRFREGAAYSDFNRTNNQEDDVQGLKEILSSKIKQIEQIQRQTLETQAQFARRMSQEQAPNSAFTSQGLATDFGEQREQGVTYARGGTVQDDYMDDLSYNRGGQSMASAARNSSYGMSQSGSAYGRASARMGDGYEAGGSLPGLLGSSPRGSLLSNRSDQYQSNISRSAYGFESNTFDRDNGREFDAYGGRFTATSTGGSYMTDSMSYNDRRATLVGNRAAATGGSSAYTYGGGAGTAGGADQFARPLMSSAAKGSLLGDGAGKFAGNRSWMR